jgi:predicted esterase YcpF (UPF0227 family)
VTSFHDPGRPLLFKPEYVTLLRMLTPRASSRPERYFAVIAKGDEVLDWREMTARYAGCRIKLLEGGDHALATSTRTCRSRALPRAVASPGDAGYQ